MQVISDILVSRKTNIVASGETGQPDSLKTTPKLERVNPTELELTWRNNPTVFNSINKVVQTIMSADHKIKAEDPEVEKYFNDFVNNIGNSGGDITWEELLGRVFLHNSLFGWAFVENIYNTNGTKIVDWDIIDPKKMDYAKNAAQNIVLDKYGKPVGYVEIIGMQYYDLMQQDISRHEELPHGVVAPSGYKWIFLLPAQVAVLPLFTVGDGFYPTGLVEPIYKTSLRKLNIESALANAIYRHGFPIIWAQLGDMNHEPTPQHIQGMLDKLQHINTKQEIATPYFYDLKILESKKFDKLSESLEYFIDQEVTGMGVPKPFATGGGQETNRATLASQAAMFELTLNDIIQRVTTAIEKYMFKPMADLEGFSEVPQLVWDRPGVDAINKMTDRLLQWVKAGVLEPRDIESFVKKVEQLE